MSVPLFLRLVNGCKMPSVGLGTFQMKGDQLREALDFALSIGYRHIDTAASYGNEKEVGEVINDRLRAGHVKRKELFITSKVPRLSLTSQKDINTSAIKSLDDLKLSYLDMLLIHTPWPAAEEKDDQGEVCTRHVPLNIVDTWRAFEFLCKEGLVSNIGVSNFTKEQIKSVLDIQKVPLSNVQMEAHIYYQQKNLKRLCDKKNIVISAYAPLGAPGRPSHHVIDNKVSLLEDPLILQSAKRYKKTQAQVLLNFLLKNGMVVLPKSFRQERIQENLGCCDWSLDNSDFEAMQGLDKGIKFFNFNYMKGHPDYFEAEEF